MKTKVPGPHKATLDPGHPGSAQKGFKVFSTISYLKSELRIYYNYNLLLTRLLCARSCVERAAAGGRVRGPLLLPGPSLISPDRRRSQISSHRTFRLIMPLLCSFVAR